MSYKLVLAEKPSVAMSIAKVIGSNKRNDGFMEGGGYLVSWCVPSPMEYKTSKGMKYRSGFRTNARALWTAVAVLRVLTNEAYVGTLTQHDPLRIHQIHYTGIPVSSQTRKQQRM